jgi:hypothetical protein
LEIIEFLVWVVIEVVGEVLFEIALELGLEGVQSTYERENRHPALASFGYLVLGAALGGLSAWLLPDPLVRPGPVPGLSIVLSTLCAAIAMDHWGRYRQSRGHATTSLATWYGGGSFAFGMSAARFIGVH